MTIVYVMLIFFVMDGEPVAQARIVPTLKSCVLEAQAMQRVMSSDPLISNLQIGCVLRGPFPKRLKI